LDVRADRPLSPFYDISSNYVYYVAGKATATLGLNRIVGPRGLITRYYSKFGDPCNAMNNSMTINMSQDAICTEKGRGGENGKSDQLVVNGCVLMQIAFSVSVQNFVITETGQIQGTGLDYEDHDAGDVPPGIVT
jgi:hypothetical protein